MINILLLIVFGLAPSLVWLFYFLRKDVHPEDNRQVVKIFVYGSLAVFPAALIQLGIFDSLSFWESSLTKTVFILFLGVALSEEILKYWVVKDKILNGPHFDEPTDLPLYLIISSLGFAASENILVIIGPGIFNLSPAQTIAISLFRFVSATFLHALASGTLGIFLALSLYQPAKRIKLSLIGFVLAISLHGLYNFSIMIIEGNVRFLIPVLILINLALVLSLGFRKLKEMKSICEVK
ncbi:MAG: PrsW family intramembrane metalloprotease [Candidatus Nealsonbacteria bacterium]|nr:PrsW family intramembrane metalloprotease [Candidatus Nealsonbacteria bacterium]